ncbi:DNA cytosine methyltransferase [Paraburkholderia sp. Ac-20342]|uniref:DNA cytosine methyltransferase n=1 Tax=Paraburkholderia sp. Ac-20342 TaxID=2703889 RepID=UPI001F12074B|nr:DNA cytosine methyltransferase [Paraburkholderia sp. Ac-20342]
MAGWDDSRPVWSGSPPCQPFSVGGKKAGFADERHLWPAFHWLIGKCRPARFYGEQVAAASEWLNLVRSDLEALDYAVGAIPIEAASAGADHFRDRYFIVADLSSERRNWPATWAEQARSAIAAGGCDRPLVDDSGLGWGEGWTEHEFRSRGFSAPVASIDGCQYVECPDGKWRRLPPPRVRWLGNGIPARVAKLRALGNAIDPRPAAEFIRAADEALTAQPSNTHRDSRG